MNPALEQAKKNEPRIRKYVNDRIRYHDVDMDDAVEYAIAQVYGNYSEDAQADVFAAIRHVFDEHPHDGTGRSIALKQALRNYAIRRITG
ncbi:hypothetical protein [Stenotrophomonas phage BUCT609]|uniref:Uncharacterized protein n=1 Tax=Stenotrophomonas phage BUCT609 TaxID=2834250 RepID=A0A8E6URR0_9CAUD|nr:hypothetical protein [Stenotrophomonas phage BUCT609]